MGPRGPVRFGSRSSPMETRIHGHQVCDGGTQQVPRLFLRWRRTGVWRSFLFLASFCDDGETIPNNSIYVLVQQEIPQPGLFTLPHSDSQQEL